MAGSFSNNGADKEILLSLFYLCDLVLNGIYVNLRLCDFSLSILNRQLNTILQFLKNIRTWQ